MMDSEAVRDSRKYYLSKSKQKEECDYLDQGYFMTKVRHDFVCKHLKNAGVVLDYGCGTGQIFQNPNFEFNGIFYLGADFIQERETLFRERAEGKAPVDFLYVKECSDYLNRLETLLLSFPVDTLVLCGILGYEGFTDLKRVCSSIHKFRQLTTIITVPTETEEYKEEVIHRFSKEEVLSISSKSAVKLHDGLYGLIL